MKAPLTRPAAAENRPPRPDHKQKKGLPGTAEVSLFSQLSPPRQALIRLCQAINFGFIEMMEVRDCDPMFDPPPLLLRDLKLDLDEGPRFELALRDFVVSNEVLRLLRHLDEMKCGSVRRIEVRAGIPRRVLLTASTEPIGGPNRAVSGRARIA